MELHNLSFSFDRNKTLDKKAYSARTEGERTDGTKRSRSSALDGVNLSLHSGQILGLVGASGAGKSSIARAILRLIDVDQGEILLNGDDICKMSAQQLGHVRRRIQIVFQNPSASLSPRRSIRDTLIEPLRHFKIDNHSEQNEKINETIRTVGLEEDVLDRFPDQFSSGQQQRIAIARALITDPDLLIADEAVSALDVSVQAQILQLFRSLQSSRGISILFISHDLAAVRQIADSVAVMDRGRIVEQSTADAFFGGPSHPYSRSLLALALSQTKANVKEDESAMKI